MDEIKKVLQCDARLLNQSIVETQIKIDKCFNSMLDNLLGTDEYRNAKVEYDLKNQEKWFYYGRLGAVEKILRLIYEQEKKDILDEDIEAYNYFESVGAEELPF